MTPQPNNPGNMGRHFKNAEPAVGHAASASPAADGANETAATAAPAAPVSGTTASSAAPADDVTTADMPRRRTAVGRAPGESTASSETGEPAPLPKLPDDPHAGLVKKRKKHHRKARRRLRVLAIVLAVVVVLVGAGAAGVWYLVNQGASAIRDASAAEDLETADDAETEDEGRTVVYNGKTYRYNENIVSIVVMGYDRRSYQDASTTAGQADAVMVVAFDTETGSMRVIGIPRDTMVDVDENIGEAFVGQDKLQLALAFAYGDGYGTSAENVTRAVGRILYNMPMTYYFAIDMQGIGPLNDAVGGVTLTPTTTIPNTNIYEGQQTTLLGQNALKYIQWRSMTDLTASLDRQARQSQYLQAFFAQAIASAKGNPASLVSLYQTATQYSTTNLGLSEFSYLASKVIENGMSQIDVTTLTGEAVQGARYMEYYLDETSTYETVLDVYYTLVDDGSDDEGDAVADTDGSAKASDKASGKADAATKEDAE